MSGRAGLATWSSWSQLPSRCPIPCPCDLPGNRTDLGHCVIFPHSGSARGPGAGTAKPKPSRRPAKWLVSLWEDRGSRPSKASLQAAAVGQTVLKMNGERPWGVEGSGRPQAVGERVAGVLKGTGRVVGDREGLLHNVGSPLSPKGWGGLEEGRGVGRPGAQRPPVSASGSRALGLQVSTVLGVPTTSPHENPKGQVIFVHLPVDSAVMGHLCWEYRGWGPCPQGTDSRQR